MSEHSVVRQEPLKINRFTSETVERGGVKFINNPNGVVASWEPPPGFDPQAHAQQHNLSNIGYETHTDSITGETRSIAYTEMSHEEYEELRQSPQGRVLELPPMPAEKIGNTLGMITFKPSVSPTRAALANPPEIPPEDIENPEAPEGERTSEKLKQLTAEREALNKKLINSDAADEYVRFDDLHGSLNDLIGEIKGEPGTISDYAAQGTRGLLGFAKDALVGVGELAYEGSKLVLDVQQAMLTPAGIQGQILDAQILLENIRLGNVTTGTMTSGAANTATSVGKALVAPVTDAWAKGQYVESITRATAEIATLPFVALKSSKAAKGADVLIDPAKINKSGGVTSDASTANKAAKAGDTSTPANASEAAKAPEPQGPKGNGGKIKQIPPSKKPQVLTNHQKAAIGEKTAHDEMVSQGHTPLGNTDGVYQPGQTGIDGVYKNANPPPDYIITEAKYGTAKLGKTTDGKQLSDSWVTGGSRLENAGLTQKDIKAIREGLEFGDGTVEKRLIRVKPDGSVTSKTIK